MNFQNMTSTEIRTHMAQLGWFSEDRLSNLNRDGITTYTIRFERYNWHGIKLIKRIAVTDSTSSLNSIQNIVERAATTALRIWETHPTKLPKREFFGGYTPPENDFEM